MPSRHFDNLVASRFHDWPHEIMILGSCGPHEIPLPQQEAETPPISCCPRGQSAFKTRWLISSSLSSTAQ
jgi:hypothetical protein